ncbi:MAG TPA: TSUP family transporter, partial [Chloroflexia bacterium]|nr:TSUP family transporter [Chloroflexia bacterium]
MDFFFYGGLAVTGFGAGLLGALLGLGGGVFVVPALTLIFGLPTLTAVGTSNVAVVATSTAGASTYVKSRLTNIRLGLVLLISTTLAA